MRGAGRDEAELWRRQLAVFLSSAILLLSELLCEWLRRLTRPWHFPENLKHDFQVTLCKSAGGGFPEIENTTHAED